VLGLAVEWMRNDMNDTKTLEYSVTELHEHFSKVAKHFTEGWAAMMKAVQPALDLHSTVNSMLARLDSDTAILRRFFEESRTGFDRLRLGPAQELARVLRRTKSLDEAGWLAHYTMPWAYAEECNGGTLKERLSDFYQRNWKHVRSRIASRIPHYIVDAEAKATFREALDAHEAGLYRCVCRVLLPAVERVARIELHGNSLQRITDQRKLRELAGNLTLREIEPQGFYGTYLFRRLIKHLYEHVEDEADRKRFAQDPVPNRHAALHGLVIYSSMQNSLNTIFMADYVFQVISALKRSALQSN
jgi:hypothetical protein